MRLTRIAVPLLLATFAGAAIARAQETQGLRFLDAGKPAGGIPVFSLVNGIKTQTTTTGTDGTVSIPIDALGFGKGEEVAVWVKRCEDGRVVEVILTRASEDNPCPPEEGAEAGARCTCERIGFLIWGGGPAEIDIGTGSVTQNLTGIGWRETLTFGVKFNMTNWLKLEDVVLDAPGATSAEVDRWTPGVAMLLETAPWGNRFYVGLEGTYSMVNTQTQFGSQTQTGDITYLSVGPYARYNVGSLDVGPMNLWFFGMAMASYAWNMGDFSTDGLSEERDHETWRGEFGGGFYHYSRAMWGFMFQALYSMTGDDPDAEEHIRFGAGLIYRPFRPFTYEQ